MTAVVSAAPRAQGPGRAPGEPARKAWWPALRLGLTLTFFGLLAWLLVVQARTIAWDDVGDAMLALPPAVLLAAGALAGASHLLYSTYDLLGRRVTGHTLPTSKVMAVTFVSYAFNLNMGSLVGGVASRYRLYTRLGLDHLQVTRVMLFSMLTNWLGYLLLGGVVFALFPLPLPKHWGMSDTVLQVTGSLLAVVAVVYVALCAFSRKRSVSLRGHALELPSGRMALLQLGMSSLNWALMAGAIYVLAGQQVAYATVLAVLLLAAVAGVLTHVPAGLGVLEAVFIALLGAQIPPATLLGILLAYRALYYLAPLALAVPLFVAMELRHRKKR